MKKVLSMILALTMVFSVALFAGCGSDDNGGEPAGDNGAAASADASADAAGVAGKNYIIYSDNAFAPFEFDQDGTYVGIDMDLLAAIAEDQGFTYEMHNEGFDASMGAVQSGQADAMIAGMTIKPERQETFDFSDGYFEDGQILVVAEGSDIASMEDLAGKSVAVKTSTAGADYAAQMAEEIGFELTYYEDSPTMYTAVVNGTNDACFEDYSVIGWAIKSEGIKLQTVGDVVNAAPYGFAVKKGTNADLIAAFNAGLANIKANGKYDEILAKYGY